MWLFTRLRIPVGLDTFLTGYHRSRLIFVSTDDFLRSAIRPVIPLPQKIACENKSAARYRQHPVRNVV